MGYFNDFACCQQQVRRNTLWHQTHQGFLSEAMFNDQGEEISTIEIKKILQQIVEDEDKSKPYPDDRLAEILKEKGYPIARRTVAKYREQLDIPVARMRKKI
ncbi:MAG TPA: hypothetical protein VKY82_04830 [Flavobacterium sp.]|nr:hypothetical protein [Flavobacterium sp.]